MSAGMDTNRMDSSATILYIDDDALLAKTIAMFLRQRGYLVQTAQDGQEGLRIFHDQHPNVLLCDLRMPGMDGIEVIKAIRKTDTRTPIIVVSGAGVLSDAISALRHGAWDFVTKPILEMGVLEHSIESVLERARLLQENEEYHLHLEERVKSQTKLLRAEIEERERTEVRLKEMLGERDVLLKEVHHRVKNNLQLVSSLLSLNSRFSSNSEVRRILLESRNKIRSMWLAHELLYSSAELSRIRLPDYFRKIVNLLAGSGLEAQDLKFNVDVDDIRISISLAIPCGLIVTELVTNAMRHAFDGRQTGSVGLTARSKDNNLTIELIDDGIGFPEGKGLNTTETLGLQIVKRLVAQLHGEIELQSASGRTRIQVVFPLS